MIVEHAPKEGYYVEWQEDDLRLFLEDDGEWTNEHRVVRPRAGYNLLMALAAENANYFSSMSHTRFASDDDTDYINSHSEAMLAGNALWYDRSPEMMIEWLNLWANWIDDDEIVATETAFTNQDEELMIQFIVGRIAS